MKIVLSNVFHLQKLQAIDNNLNKQKELKDRQLN